MGQLIRRLAVIAKPCLPPRFVIITEMYQTVDLGGDPEQDQEQLLMMLVETLPPVPQLTGLSPAKVLASKASTRASSLLAVNNREAMDMV